MYLGSWGERRCAFQCPSLISIWADKINKSAAPHTHVGCHTCTYMGDHHSLCAVGTSEQIVCHYQGQPFLLNLFKHLSLIPFFLQDDIRFWFHSHPSIRFLYETHSITLLYLCQFPLLYFQHHSPPHIHILKRLNHISCFSASFIWLIFIGSLCLLLLIGNSPLVLLKSSHVPVLYLISFFSPSTHPGIIYSSFVNKPFCCSCHSLHFLSTFSAHPPFI